MRRYGPVIAHCTDSEDFPLAVGESSGAIVACMVSKSKSNREKKNLNRHITKNSKIFWTGGTPPPSVPHPTQPLVKNSLRRPWYLSEISMNPLNRSSRLQEVDRCWANKVTYLCWSTLLYRQLMPYLQSQWNCCSRIIMLLYYRNSSE